MSEASERIGQRAMKGCVYILQDKNKKFYIGSTTDIKRRLKQHSYGHTQTTRQMQSPSIKLIQEYETIQEARDVERKLKKLKRKDYVEKMILDGYIRLSAHRSTDRT